MSEPHDGSVADTLERVILASKTRAKSHRLASIVQRGAFVVVAGGIATIAQFLDWGADGYPSISQLAGIFASGIATFCGAILLIFERDADDHLALATEATLLAEQAKHAAEIAMLRYDQIDDYRLELELVNSYKDLVTVLHGIASESISTMAGGDVAIAQSFLRLAARLIVITARFENADDWTICIYRSVDTLEGKALKLMAHHRAIQCSIDKARVWPIGKGVAGVSLANRRPMKIPNMQVPEVRALIGMDGLSRPDDDYRYRSMVAYPVFLHGQAEPVAVVTATNDRFGHFNHDQQEGIRPEEPISLLADFLGLALSIAPQHIRKQGSQLPAKLDVHVSQGSGEKGDNQE